MCGVISLIIADSKTKNYRIKQRDVSHSRIVVIVLIIYIYKIKLIFILLLVFFFTFCVIFVVKGKAFFTRGHLKSITIGLHYSFVRIVIKPFSVKVIVGENKLGRVKLFIREIREVFCRNWFISVGLCVFTYKVCFVCCFLLIK